jgi:hypothetical protein
MIVGTIAGKINNIYLYFIDISSIQLALATGATIPIMMWLFQSVINGLVTIGISANGGANATTGTNWYIRKHCCHQ